LVWLLSTLAVLSFVSGVFLLRGTLMQAVRSPEFTQELSSFLLVVLTGLVALGAFGLSRQHDATWDLTRLHEFKLSPQALSVCEGLNEEVTIRGYFVRKTANGQRFLDLSRALGEGCPSVRISLVDPVVNPREAVTAGAISDGGLVVMSTSDGREVRLEGMVDEPRLMQSLVTLVSDVEHRVCWVSGHGEASPFDEVDVGAMGVVVHELQRWNYEVVVVHTLAHGIPSDCGVVVLARSQKDGFPFEREALAAFIAQGGKAMIMVDLVDHDPTPETVADLARYGVNVGTDLIVDLNPQNQMLGVDDPAFVVLTGSNLSLHPITSSLNGVVVLGVARSVSPIEGAPGLHVQTVLQTSAQAWAETDLDPASEVTKDPDELTGEIPVMVAVNVLDPDVLEVQSGRAVEPLRTEQDPMGLEGDIGRAVPLDWTPNPGGRLLVVGDADFASNGLARFGSNKDLFLNGVAWLVDEGPQIGARSPRLQSLEFTDFSGAAVMLVSLILLPGIAMMGALATWIRRRPR